MRQLSVLISISGFFCLATLTGCFKGAQKDPGVKAFATALESIPPVTTPSVAGGSFNASVTLTLNCLDDVQCAAISYTMDGSVPDFAGTGVVIGGPIASLTVGAGPDGVVTLKFRAKDTSGNLEVVKSAIFTIDRVLPTVVIAPGTGTYTSAQSPLLTCADNRACLGISYKVNGGDPDFAGNGIVILGTSAPLSFGDGVYSVKYRAKDLAGNVSATSTASFTIDSQPPNTTANPASGAFDTPQVIRLSCSDAQGCQGIGFTLDGTDPSFSGNGSVTQGISTDIPLGEVTGNVLLKFRSRYLAGNLEAVRSQAYSFNLMCGGSQITLAGGAPCDHRCGSNAFELSATDVAHTACKCVPTHEWIPSRSQCLVNQRTLTWLTGG